MSKLLIFMAALCMPMATAQLPPPVPELHKLTIPQPSSFVEGVVVPEHMSMASPINLNTGQETWRLVTVPFLVGTFPAEARSDRMQLWIFNCTHPLNEDMVCSAETLTKKLGKSIPENRKYDPRPVMLSKYILIFYAPEGDHIFYRVGAR